MFNLHLKVSIPQQSGFAIIPLLVLALIGIAAGTLLIQNRTNFLPKAATEPYSQLKGAVGQLPADSGVYIILPDGTTITKNETQQKYSYSVIKLWIAGAASFEGKFSQNESDINLMLINSDNDAANRVIDNLGGLQVVDRYIKNVGYLNTTIKRKLAATPTAEADNYTTARDAVNYIQKLYQGETSDGANGPIQNILKKRTASASDFMPNPPDVLKNDFIGKSGYMWPPNPQNGSNDVGTFSNISGQRVFFAILIPTNGDQYKNKIKEIEQFLYNGPQTAAAANPAAPAVQPASGQPLGISNQKCNARQLETCNAPAQPKGGCVVDNAGGGWCKYEAAREGTKCNEDTHGKGCGNAECRVIDGLPRCLSTQCTTGENSYCSPNAECAVADKPIDGEKFSYTYCKLKAGSAPAAPAAAAPRAVGQPIAAGAPAAATAPKPGPESAQKAGSFDNKVPEVACPNPAHKTHCETYFKEHGLSDKSQARCYTINGSARCKYEKNFAGCSADDAKACTGRGGCVLEKITVGSDQIQFSRCADDQSSSAASAQSGNTGCENLKDTDGLTIPCYKIGVFTPEELKATEAQAKVALQRYDQYKKVLSEVSGEIDSAVKAKAEEKIREAERLANACLAK